MDPPTPSRTTRSLRAIERWMRTRTALVKRDLHTARVLGMGLISTHRPLLVQMIPMRRCNLACAYCNEYDNFSKPLPLDVMTRRIDKVASFGTAMIGISGGEPLMHPQLDDIISHVRKRGMVAGLLTNGFLLTETRIKRLNAAGVEFLQISIDNVQPDDVSVKSLKTLDKKLQLLAQYGEIGVNINSVIGSGVKNPEDALTIAERAHELGFTTTVGIVHNGDGGLKPMSDHEQAIYWKIKNTGVKSYGWLSRFEKNLVEGKPNDWKCRAGSRFFYVDEFGLVHYCSQQRGYPGVPLENYSLKDLRREYLTEKSCAPYCTVACVNRISMIDSWRDPQTMKSRVPVETTLEGQQAE